MNPDLCSAENATGLVASLLATTDCRASSLVERGYAVLSSPGAATAAMLTSLMVIAVALYGYRLLLGRGLVLGEVVSLAIRLGVVLLLAASWSTFQAVAYDAVAREPTRIASDLVVAIEAPPPLVGVQSALDRIAQLNIGWRTRAGIASPLVGGAPTAAMTLNVASFLLTISTLGVLVVSRILLAMLIAITPLLAGFLLFDATRGLLEGWLRVLITAAVIPLFVLILTAIELSILAPLLDEMLRRQANGQFELDDVTPVGLVVLVFGLATFASVRVAATIAGGIRLRRSARSSVAPRDPLLSAAVTSRLLSDTIPAAAALPVVRALEAAARRDDHASAVQTVAASLSGWHARAPGVAAVVRGPTTAVQTGPRPAAARPGLVRASRAAARRDA